MRTRAYFTGSASPESEMDNATYCVAADAIRIPGLCQGQCVRQCGSSAAIGRTGEAGGPQRWRRWRLLLSPARVTFTRPSRHSASTKHNTQNASSVEQPKCVLSLPRPALPHAPWPFSMPLGPLPGPTRVVSARHEAALVHGLRGGGLAAPLHEVQVLDPVEQLYAVQRLDVEVGPPRRLLEGPPLGQLGARGLVHSLLLLQPGLCGIWRWRGSQGLWREGVSGGCEVVVGAVKRCVGAWSGHDYGS